MTVVLEATRPAPFGAGCLQAGVHRLQQIFVAAPDLASGASAFRRLRFARARVDADAAGRRDRCEPLQVGDAAGQHLAGVARCCARLPRLPTVQALCAEASSTSTAAAPCVRARDSAAQIDGAAAAPGAARSDTARQDLSAMRQARVCRSGISVRPVDSPGVSAKAPPLPVEAALACPVTSALPSTRLHRSGRVIRTAKETGAGTGPAHAARTRTASAPADRGCSSVTSKRGAPGFAANCTCDVLGSRRPRPVCSTAMRVTRTRTSAAGTQEATVGLPRPSPAASRLAGLNRPGRSRTEPLRPAVTPARAGAGRPPPAAADRVGGRSGRCGRRASPPRGLRCEWSPDGGR